MVKLILSLLFTSPLWFGIALFAASEYGGETVFLHTLDERGNAIATKLWVVDLHDEPWVRAGRADATWVERIEINSEVFLERDGEKTRLRAEIWDDDGPETINYMMREKYGYADMVVSLIHDADAVVPIRLREPDRD